MDKLRQEAKALGLKGYSTLKRADLIEAIRKVKYKDASTQTSGPYCEPCVKIAWQKNLEQYLRDLAQRHVVHDGDLLIDQDTGEVLVI